MRSAVTMSPDRGGIFDVMLGLVRKGLGGTAASGRQFISWVHDQDFIRTIYWLIDHEELSGPINISSPNPLPNREFMRIFRETWGAPFGLPAMKWQLALGAIFLKTETELILKSRRVVPARLIDSGFQFEFAEWDKACQNLCDRWRNGTH
jgi:NAD dependent epimerase/dehydratase family enzyme